MSLFVIEENPGHLNGAVAHFNRARDISGRWPVEVARTLFDGLNRLQTHWLLQQADIESGEVKAFRSMILDSLDAESKMEVLRSTELQSLVTFEPKILNHDVLKRHRYRPGTEIDQSLVKKASEVHRKLSNLFSEVDRQDTGNQERLLKQVAELLYIVRSNIAHGEKTPYEPDFAKAERDEAVCKLIVPVQEILIDQLLRRPCRKLVSYGSLAPGQTNHRVVEAIHGAWRRCVVRGSIRRQRGFPVLIWNPSGPDVNAHLVVSTDLPKWWSRIDRFEGSGYKRHLIPASCDGDTVIANVYVGNDWR